MHACTRWPRARRVQCTTRADGAFVEESISSVINDPSKTSPPNEMGEAEYMLAMVTNDQERDAVTTASDGDTSPRWLKVCKKKSRRKAMKTEIQGTLDLNAVRSIEKEKITIIIDPGAAISVMPKDVVPHVPKSGESENKFNRVANGSTSEAR